MYNPLFITITPQSQTSGQCVVKLSMFWWWMSFLKFPVCVSAWTTLFNCQNAGLYIHIHVLSVCVFVCVWLVVRNYMWQLYIECTEDMIICLFVCLIAGLETTGNTCSCILINIWWERGHGCLSVCLFISIDTDSCILRKFCCSRAHEYLSVCLFISRIRN